MANSVLVRAEPVTASRRAIALASAAALALTALLAFAGQMAGSPAAAALPQLAGFGPGQLGVLRARAPGAPADAGVTASAAQQALASTPLADEPYTALAAAGFGPGGAVGSRHDGTLLREAIRRNPRSREARLLLMRHALGGGNLGEAIDQLAVLSRLNSAAAGQLMAALGVAVRTPAQLDEAIAALKPHPELYKTFLVGFAVADKPPALVVRLVSGLPSSVMADPANRRIAIGQMVRSGAYAEARELWGRTLPGKKAAPSQLVHSPDFSDTNAPPPFNWELFENTSGAAERLPGGGAALAYYGRVPGSLATQLLTLPTGRYKAELRYRSLSGSPGAIVLKVFCAREGTLLTETPLNAAAGKDTILKIGFSVPGSGCSGQYLALAGRVQTARDAQEISVQRLSVQRESGT